MNPWITLLISIAGSFMGSTLTFVLFFRPITNTIAAKVLRKMTRQISAKEDEFASRNQV